MKRGRKSVPDGVRERHLVIINRPFLSPQKRCDKCSEPSGMITPEEAAALCEVSTRTIYRWLEMASIHFSESEDEALLICLKSLAAVSSLEGSGPIEP